MLGFKKVCLSIVVINLVISSVHADPDPTEEGASKPSNLESNEGWDRNAGKGKWDRNVVDSNKLNSPQPTEAENSQDWDRNVNEGSWDRNVSAPDSKGGESLDFVLRFMGTESTMRVGEEEGSSGRDVEPEGDSRRQVEAFLKSLSSEDFVKVKDSKYSAGDMYYMYISYFLKQNSLASPNIAVGKPLAFLNFLYYLSDYTKVGDKYKIMLAQYNVKNRSADLVERPSGEVDQVESLTELFKRFPGKADNRMTKLVLLSPLSYKTKQQILKIKAVKELNQMASYLGLRVENDKQNSSMLKIYEQGMSKSVLELQFVSDNQVNITRNGGKDLVSVDISAEYQQIQSYLNEVEHGRALTNTKGFPKIQNIYGRIIAKLSQASLQWQKQEAQTQVVTKKSASHQLMRKARWRNILSFTLLIPAYALYHYVPLIKDNVVLASSAYSAIFLYNWIKALKENQLSSTRWNEYLQLDQLFKRGSYFKSAFTTNAEYDYALKLLELYSAKISGRQDLVSAIICKQVFN